MLLCKKELCSLILKNCKIGLDNRYIESSLVYTDRKIYLETTTRCNNYCQHCFNRSGEKENDLSVENIIELERGFCNLGNITQVLLSGGEFFSNPSYFEILQFISCKYDVKVLSNGKFVPSDFLDLLSSRKNIGIQITLNGCTSQVDEIIRGACFDNTVSNIRKINNYGCSNSLTVATTLFRANINDIRAMIDFCLSIGVKRIQFSFIYKLGRAVDNWARLSISSYEKLIALDEIQKLSLEYQDEISITSSGMRCFCSKIYSGDSDYTCQELSEELVITPSLSALFCPKYDVYCECKGFSKLQYSDLSQGSCSIINLLDDKCSTCLQFRECLASCVI